MFRVGVVVAGWRGCWCYHSSAVYSKHLCYGIASALCALLLLMSRALHVSLYRDVLELLCTLYSDCSTVVELNDISMKHLEFIRATVFHNTTRCKTGLELRRVFEAKEKNKDRSREVEPTRSKDVLAKMDFVVKALNAGLETCSTDELARVASYLDDLDPLAGSEDSLKPSVLATSVSRSLTSSSATVSTRPSPATAAAGGALRLVCCHIWSL